jgi:hypothetical protein
VSVESLRDALARAGVAAQVEARGKLVVLSPNPSPQLDVASRRRIVAIAHEHGFTNVAIEIAA